MLVIDDVVGADQGKTDVLILSNKYSLQPQQTDAILNTRD
jgi:hypothetical protein